MEAGWVAAEMRAGGAYAHSTITLHTLADGHGGDGRRAEQEPMPLGTNDPGGNRPARAR